VAEKERIAEPRAMSHVASRLLPAGESAQIAGSAARWRCNTDVLVRRISHRPLPTNGFDEPYRSAAVGLAGVGLGGEHGFSDTQSPTGFSHSRVRESTRRGAALSERIRRQVMPLFQKTNRDGTGGRKPTLSPSARLRARSRKPVRVALVARARLCTEHLVGAAAVGEGALTTESPVDAVAGRR